jgi:hypothetical protein
VRAELDFAFGCGRSKRTEALTRENADCHTPNAKALSKNRKLNKKNNFKK